MMELGRVATAVGKAAQTLGHEIALVGGFAISVRAEPRFTRDIDVAVAVANDDEAEALVRQLLGSGYQVEATEEQDAANRLATVRLVGSMGELVDLLFASSGIEDEIVVAATPVEVLPDVMLPVAQVGHLIAMKLLSRSEARPNDQADLRALLQAATPADLALADEAVALIDQRGYSRDRDLRADLATLRKGVARTS